MKRILASVIILLFFTSCVSMSNVYEVSVSNKEKRKVENKTSKTTAKTKSSERATSSEPRATITSDEDMNIEVLLMTASKGFTIKSDSNITVSKPEISAKTIRVAYRDGNIAINDVETSAKEVVLRSDSLFKINSKKFRGDMIIRKDGSKIYLVNKLPLDFYLYGVLPSEISPSWHKEALKAQAVAARSFVIHNKMNSKFKLYDVDSTVVSQVYKGVNVEDDRTNQAVKDTNREVLVHDGKVIEAFFHANSGGRTAASEEVWGGKLPYLKVVDDNYCNEGKHYEWETELNTSEISEILKKRGLDAGEIYDIKTLDRSHSNRISKLKIYGSNGTFTVKGKDFRNYLGVDKLRSTNFELRFAGKKVKFKGFGWGHGVGLSQEGAKGMAERGMSYKAILEHFYNNCRIKRIR